MSFDSDLIFFFNENLAMKTNMISALQGSSYVPIRHMCIGKEMIATYDEPYDDDLFYQLSLYKSISKRYFSLPIIARRQLDALFNRSYYHVFPPEVQSAFGYFGEPTKTNIPNTIGALFFTFKTNSANPTDWINELISISIRRGQAYRELSKANDQLYKQLKTIWRQYGKSK